MFPKRKKFCNIKVRATVHEVFVFVSILSGGDSLGDNIFIISIISKFIPLINIICIKKILFNPEYALCEVFVLLIQEAETGNANHAGLHTENLHINSFLIL